MLRQIFMSIVLLSILLPLHGKDLEVYVRVENTLVPLSVSLSLSPADAHRQKQLLKLTEVLLRDLALGDRLQPFFVKADATTCPLHLIVSSRYPEIAFLLKETNRGPEKITSVILSENTEHHRQQIHEAADKIHYHLTHIPGISSGKIVFSLSAPHKDQELTQGELWCVDYDGHNLQPVTKDLSLSVTPKWFSPDASKYFYVSYKFGIPKIFMGSLNHPMTEKVLHLPGNQFMPTFSPKKKLLAFVSDINGNPDLFIQPFSLATGAVGKPKRLLNEKFGTQGNPSFSPDGSKLVFVSNKDGLPRLYIMQLFPEVLPPRLLTKKYRNSSCPTWSPDGKKIAFCAAIKGVRQICVYDLTTGQDSQLTSTPLHKESPSWAIDSHHLVFSAGNASESELYLLSLITQKSKKIVIGSGEKRFPSWGAFSK